MVGYWIDVIMLQVWTVENRVNKEKYFSKIEKDKMIF